MSSDQANAVKQQAQFMAWGMPTIYIATSAVILGAFVPHFKANLGYIQANISGFVGKLAIFGAVNLLCSIFLYFSAAIHYSLINFALNFMVLCTVTLPNFPKDFAKPLALVFVVWTMVFTGVAPVNNGLQGIMTLLSRNVCSAYYKSEPTVTDKICKDGWITFTVFCGIITVGLTFLTNLLLISLATDPAHADAPSAANANEESNNNNNNNGYQQPAVAGAADNNGDYQSYQNADGQLA